MGKYTIDNNTIYFSNNFNESLRPYYTVLLQVSSISFKKNTYESHLLHSTFNHHVINLPSNIKSITFGWEYNKPFSLCPSIEHLEFGHDFNHPIVLGQKLKTLIFGDNFNCPIFLTPNIITLIFGNNFNQHIMLTKNIQTLKFGYQFNKSIQLPPNIISLEMGYCYNQSITINVRIKRLILSAGLEHNVQLNATKTLEIISFYSNAVPNYVLDKNITECKILHRYHLQPHHNLNKGLKRFTSLNYTTCTITKNITHLDIGTCYTHYRLGKK